MTKQSETSSSKHICKFCKKEFRREKTLFVHSCEQKRRWLQKGDTGPRIGLTAFQQFFKATQTGKEKTNEDFVKSPYYTAFVKYGWYVHQIRAVNPTLFTTWLLNENIKLDWWTKDRYYEKYVIEFMKKEAPDDGIARTVKELNRWAKENDTELDQFFKEASANKIANMISNGRLSPWFLFNCDQGVNILSEFNEDQITLAFKWIDPAFWEKKFKNNPDDVKWIKQLLGHSGFNG